jgi:hypothetical protein
MQLPTQCELGYASTLLRTRRQQMNRHVCERTKPPHTLGISVYQQAQPELSAGGFGLMFTSITARHGQSILASAVTETNSL